MNKKNIINSFAILNLVTILFFTGCGQTNNKETGNKEEVQQIEEETEDLKAVKKLISENNIDEAKQLFTEKYTFEGTDYELLNNNYTLYYNLFKEEYNDKWAKNTFLRVYPIDAVGWELALENNNKYKDRFGKYYKEPYIPDNTQVGDDVVKIKEIKSENYNNGYKDVVVELKNYSYKKISYIELEYLFTDDKGNVVNSDWTNETHIAENSLKKVTKRVDATGWSKVSVRVGKVQFK